MFNITSELNNSITAYRYSLLTDLLVCVQKLQKFLAKNGQWFCNAVSKRQFRFCNGKYFRTSLSLQEMNKFAVSVDLPQGNLGSRSILVASNIEKFKQRRKLVYSLSLKTDKERKNKLFRQYWSVFSESLLSLSGGHRRGKMSHPLRYCYISALRLLHIIALYSSPHSPPLYLLLDSSPFAIICVIKKRENLYFRAELIKIDPKCTLNAKYYRSRSSRISELSATFAVQQTRWCIGHEWISAEEQQLEKRLYFKYFISSSIFLLK